MATDAYFTGKIVVMAPAFAFVLLTGIFILVNIAWGIYLLIKHRWKEAAPVMVFFAGFVLIHMVYQNTKERYVMPLLWAWFLFLFYGLVHGFYPWLKEKTARADGRIKRTGVYAALLSLGAAWALGVYLLGTKATVPHLLFAAGFTVLAAWLLSGAGPNNLRSKVLLIVLCGVVINFSVAFGVRAMDHYSLRRVEFKKAGLWFKEHYRPGDRLLVAEVPTTVYYAGLDSGAFNGTSGLKSKNLDELAAELAKLNITYVFVDDFYIRRLRVNDKNAIDKKAPLMLLLREKGEATGRFRLLESFETRGGIRSYIFHFIP